MSRSERPLAVMQRALPAVGLVVVVVLIVVEVRARSGDFTRSLHLLEHPDVGFVILAVGLEALSYLAYGRAQQLLTIASGRRLRVPWLVSLSLAAQVLLNFLPAGYVAANVLNFRELRRRGLAGALCAWLLGFTSLLYIGAVLTLACAGAVIDRHGGWVPRVLGACGLLVIALLATVSTGPGVRLRLGRLKRLPLSALVWLERHQGLPARIAVGSRDVAAQMAAVRLTRGEVAGASALFTCAWLADCGCLACGFAAVGISPPWDSLLIAYSIAQLLALLPVSPGGLGLVEGSLAITLTGAGRGLSVVLAAILFYRALSYWATLPAGAVGYVALRHARSHDGRVIRG